MENTVIVLDTGPDTSDTARGKVDLFASRGHCIRAEMMYGKRCATVPRYSMNMWTLFEIVTNGGKERTTGIGACLAESCSILQKSIFY
jgi:hypothetical protein